MSALRRVASAVLALLFVLLSGSPLLGVARAQGPQVGDAFEYTFHRWTGNGQQEYEGYHDNTYSSGRYEITAATATHATVHAAYGWSYSDTEGLQQSGFEDRTVSFNLTTRLYASSRTDLDDFDALDGTTLAVWFWIPPEVRVGETIRILDDLFAVTSRDAIIWTNWVPKRGIEVRTQGASTRADVYGLFSYTYTDAYYFDPQTGYVIAEDYREHDTGTYFGRVAAFDRTEDFDITASTYPVPVDYLALAFVWLLIGLFFLGLAFVGYLIRWRVRFVSRSRYVAHQAEVRRVRLLKEFPRLPTRATRAFLPFVEDFARKALLSKDRLAVATAVGELVGLGVYNRQARIGMVLCENTPTAETLRSFLGAKDFFSETRHPIPEGMREEALKDLVRIQEPYAYNVFETYSILKLSMAGSPGYAYDANLVSRMKPSDLPAIGAVAKRVYKVRSDRWLRGQYTSGDLGFVARVDGRVVGFAFATAVDSHGRIHTLTVLPEFRGSGIGKELMRARLEALRVLGVEDVIAEIADWNLGSLQIAWTHGFRPVGKMYVETVRTRRIKRNIVRR